MKLKRIAYWIAVIILPVLLIGITHNQVVSPIILSMFVFLGFLSLIYFGNKYNNERNPEKKRQYTIYVVASILTCGYASYIYFLRRLERKLFSLPMTDTKEAVSERFESRVQEQLKHLESISGGEIIVMPEAKKYFGPSETGNQEIDHVIITPNGVFHMDSKCYAGRLEFFGEYQYIHYGLDGKAKADNDNMIGQADRHRRILKSILGSDEYIFDAICIPDRLLIIGQEKALKTINFIRIGTVKEFFQFFKSGVNLSAEEREHIKELLYASMREESKCNTDM